MKCGISLSVVLRYVKGTVPDGVLMGNLLKKQYRNY
jgi:hypothetical protein